MSGSSMIAQTLLPGKSAEALQRNGTHKKSDQSFAELFEKRMQVRRENPTVPVTPSGRAERQAAVADRSNEKRPLDRAEKPEKPERSEKPMTKNPAKEKMKELMKKVRDTLEAMKDPDVSPEQLQKMADDLKDYMGQIKALAEAMKEGTPSAENAETAKAPPVEAIGPAVETTAGVTAVPAKEQGAGSNGLSIGKSAEKQDAKSSAVHWDNRQTPEIKGNPILQGIEKVIEVQADILAEHPDVKKALEAVLADIKVIQSAEVTKPETAFTDKLADLMAKLNGITVKTPVVKASVTAIEQEKPQELTVDLSAEADSAETVSAVAKSGVDDQQTDAQTAEEQMAGQNQQAFTVQPVDSKEADKTEKTNKTAETSTAPIEKQTQAATKQPVTQTTQPIQNPQAFQDTLDAIKDGVEAKGQYQSRIMEQVIESVKTNFKSDDMKSEMIMKLKPESLGNVSLKVSIEKGIVMAEFQVESQAVKQALESNLQDLRSALQDKGFNVFDLNVSVRKDNQNQQQGNNGKERQTRAQRVEGNLERIEQRLMSLESVHHESTIDYLG